MRRSSASSALVVLVGLNVGLAALSAGCNPRGPLGRSLAPPPPAMPRVTVEVEDADAAEVMYTIGREVGVCVVVDHTVREAITLRLVDVPWRGALDHVARLCGCIVVERTPDRALVVTPAGRPAAMALLDPMAEPLPPEPLPPSRITIDVDDVDLSEVMDLIGRQVGRNLLVDPNVQESVTVSLRDIPWREAVDVIARMCRCDVEERCGGVLVLTQPWLRHTQD